MAYSHDTAITQKIFAVFYGEPIEKLGLCLSDYPHLLIGVKQIAIHGLWFIAWDRTPEEE